jgi:hypothetical protein
MDTAAMVLFDDPVVTDTVPWMFTFPVTMTTLERLFAGAVSTEN